MIDYIVGPVTEVRKKSVVIEIGGFGYEVFVSAQSIATLQTRDTGSKATPEKLLCFHHKMETSEKLYGFTSEAERETFNELKKTDGIGPSTAMTILCLGTTKEIGAAIKIGDWRYFSEVRGVSEIKGKRIILDLQKHYRGF